MSTGKHFALFLNSLTAGSHVLTIVIDDSVTAIQQVKAQEKDDHWYNIQGVRVNNPKNKGVYIHNGKKTILK